MDWPTLRKQALLATRKALSASVTDDNLIIQTVSAIEECDKAGNLLSKRLREWYELYSPEFSKAVGDNEAFARLVLEKSKETQLAECGVSLTMGAPLPETDVEAILTLAASVHALFLERKSLETYLETLMARHCPNMLILAGATIGAKLLREAGSMRRIATIQASTIQLYGAEKALFRHLRSGAKPPKHGFIINHPLVAKAAKQDKGRVARALADKISIACKVDYFKGEPIGASLKAALEKRFAAGSGRGEQP
jgi:nucleolar protein 56